MCHNSQLQKYKGWSDDETNDFSFVVFQTKS